MEPERKEKGCCGSEVVIELDLRHADVPVEAPDRDKANRLKELVRERYATAATHKAGCGCGCAGDSYEPAFSFVGKEYEGQTGYSEDADLGLGCGVPTDAAGIKPGDTVLDLGSGAGIDAFIAREVTGAGGRVIGVDFTPEMNRKARANAEKLGYENVQFIQGDIEDLPVSDECVDVILSNCVLNLVPHKRRAFAEMHRVLKPGGHFAVSDIVIQGQLPDRLRESAALYAGCVSGAIEMQDYLDLLHDAGFQEVAVVKERPIEIADEILRTMALEEEIAAFRRTGGIQSVTVVGKRPAIQ